MFDVGNMGFMLLASSLVMLMTPGLAFFYGGLVGRNIVLTIIMQSFVSMCIVTLLWVAVGFSMCFSDQSLFGLGIIGNFKYAFLLNISLDTPAPSGTIPMYLLFVYQMMFAIITPALITGAFADRVDFKAFNLFNCMAIICLLPFCPYGLGPRINSPTWNIRFCWRYCCACNCWYGCFSGCFLSRSTYTSSFSPTKHSLSSIRYRIALVWVEWFHCSL